MVRTFDCEKFVTDEELRILDEGNIDDDNDNEDGGSGSGSGDGDCDCDEIWTGGLASNGEK